MCLIALSWNSHPRYPLIVAANRDEFWKRPTQPLHYWSDGSGIVAGRDTQAGGSWMGMTLNGRFAAITNFREPRRHIENAPTRGHLVTDYLRSDQSPIEYQTALRQKAQKYNGFNLLVSDGLTMAYYGNRAEFERELAPGTYGLSNHLLDTPWPKVELLKKDLGRLPDSAEISEIADTLHLGLQDQSPAADEQLPDTGVGLDLERMLSARYIQSEKYGTRSSTVLIVDNQGRVYVDEAHGHTVHGPQQRTRIDFETAAK